MKKRMMILCVLLAVLLSACGGNGQEQPTAEISPTVTTAPATEPAPTEPEKDPRPAAEYTEFDKLGLQLWGEEFSTSSQPGTTYASADFSNHPYGGEVLFYRSQNRSASSYSYKSIAGASMDIYIEKENLTAVPTAMSNCFFAAAQERDPSITKEAWLAAHETNQCLRFTTCTTYSVSDTIKAYESTNSGQYWYWIYTQWPILVDKYSNQAYTPNLTDGNAASILSAGYGTVEFSALFKHDTVWNTMHDFIVQDDIYVLVPSDYDGLIFGSELYQSNWSDEYIRSLYSGNSTASAGEEEVPPWKQQSLYYEGTNRIRYYFDSIPVE